jgi:uncharacterized protein YjbJ (UPF0337 family)
MNWDKFEGKWKQLKGAARVHWSRLTEDDLDRISGRREQLIGRLQERYGLAKEVAEQQAEEWWRMVEAASGAHTSVPAHR